MKKNAATVFENGKFPLQKYLGHSQLLAISAHKVCTAMIFPMNATIDFCSATSNWMIETIKTEIQKNVLEKSSLFIQTLNSNMQILTSSPCQVSVLKN